MSSLTLHARCQMLLVVCLWFAASGWCDDQVFIDIHISVDEPVLSQALDINTWAFDSIPGDHSHECSICNV